MAARFYHTLESVSTYIKAAEGHNGSALIERLGGYLKPKAKVLEIGSGPGTDWALLSTKFETIGSDYSSVFITHLRKTYPHGHFIELDATAMALDLKFDAIYSNKVLHHLTNQELKTSIQKQVAHLNTDGVVCHSFWKGKGDEDFKGLYVNYHEVKDLHAYFEPYFEILYLESYAEFEADDSLVLIARKK